MVPDRQEFINEIEDFISIYTDDYFKEASWEFTQDDPDEPEYRQAVIKLISFGEQEWTVPVGINGDGAVAIDCGDDHYLDLDAGGFYAFLWFEACKRQARDRKAIERFIGCVLSCRQHNTREWMEGIAEDINTIAKAIGDTDTVEFTGDGLRIIRTKKVPA